MIVQCPMCHGLGGEVEVILDDGTGPWTTCGFCRGTGQMHKDKFFYQTLNFIKKDKARIINQRTRKEA